MPEIFRARPDSRGLTQLEIQWLYLVLRGLVTGCFLILRTPTSAPMTRGFKMRKSKRGIKLCNYRTSKRIRQPQQS